MKKTNLNPFTFGNPVEGDYYLPMPGLEATVSGFLENRIHVVLIGPRRFGKTSFALNLLRDLEKQGHYTCIFIDIFNITSHKDFLQQMLRALKLKSSFFKTVLNTIPKLRPKVSAEVDPHTGGASFALALDKTSSEKDTKELIQDVLAGFEKLGEKVIIAIDEFQKITEINDQGWLEATLRTHMQQLRNTAFLFTGSRKSIIYDMLNNQARPLYRSCQPIEFPSFGEEFVDWIIKRFASVRIDCEAKAIKHLMRLVQDTPNYVQMICFHLVAEGKKNITVKEVENTLDTVVKQNAYAYQTLLNSLTLTQQRALRLAAKEGKDVFRKELLEKYEIASAPALASSIKSLKEKGILDEHATGRGTVIFDDPLFVFWFKNCF
ncbi:MAG: ATP-binding protein [Chlamydiae bacterium]|nr:ATP-binding protein [Chlamydiota bacterium]